MVAPARHDLAQLVEHPGQRVGDLRQEDDVGAAGDARVQRDVAGVAAHHLENHDAMVAGRRGLKAVEGVDRDVDGGGKADGGVGSGDVVVDGLGDADHGNAALPAQPVHDAHAAVAADDDQGVEPELTVALDEILRLVGLAAIGHGIGEGIAAIGGAEQRAAHAQDAARE